MISKKLLALPRAAVFFTIVFLGSLTCRAQLTFTGVNTPGSSRDIPLTIGVGATNLSISVSNSATAFSYLVLKTGGPPSAGDFDYIADADGQDNAFHLERPDLKTTNYVLRVETPTNSLTHTYKVTVTPNDSGFRTVAKPATKALVSSTQGSLVPNTWHFFEVDIPTNISGWKLTLSSTNSIYPDLYVQQGMIPSTSAFLKRSQSLTNDVIVFSGNELPPGQYFIGVYDPPTASGTNAYTLQTELVNFTTLNWDPGIAHLGTEVYSSPDTNGGDYYFKITTLNSLSGGWRTALTVSTGDANLYLSRGTPPTVTSSLYKSERTGSDGFVLASTSFNPGEDWYFLVHALPGASWTLMSGEPFVTDLGTVATNGASGSGSVPIGGEGIRFFKTTVPANIEAWRLWLNGLTNNIQVRKQAIPLPTVNDLSQMAQMLVVPGYLAGGQLYFVGVPGNPGTLINLDSRVQAITDIPFESTNSVTVTGYGYSTFRVTVPADQLAWQVTVVPTNGNPNIALRENLVPNETNNDAYSEVSGLVADSVTLVPPTLSDGTFYVTVYGTNNQSFTLQSGNPEVTDINFVSTTTNTDTNRVGWRFFRAADTSQQLGALGWDLYLTNHVPGSRIALRRNAVPSIWNLRNPNPVTSGAYDFLSTAEFLQRPGHQADVWYVGVYNPTQALGGFTLVTKTLTADPLSFDAGTSSRTAVPPGKWQYFRVDVPTNVLGWDVRLTNVTSGSPQLYIRKEVLPNLDQIALAGKIFTPPVISSNWLTSYQWAAGKDWTERDFSASGTVNESGRILTMGMGRPLEAGTYYIGVINAASDTNAMSYTVVSRGIGVGLSIPVTDIAYNGGAATNHVVAPRDVNVYRVQIPTNVPSWKVKLSANGGDASLAIGKDRLPNITATMNTSVTNTYSPGRKMLKSGNEHFVLLPDPGLTNLYAGTYYLVVVGDGVVSPTNTTWIGTGNSDYVIQSLGPLPEIDLGLLDTADITYSDSLEGGESVAYHFHNLPDTLGFEVSLENRVGNPNVVFSGSGVLVNPGAPGSNGGSPADPYGNEGGEYNFLEASPLLVTVSGALNTETFMVKARGSLIGNIFSNATYTVRIRKLLAPSLAFDGGSVTVPDHSEVYRFFRVDVPAGAIGWDVRIVNVVNGAPELVVERDFLALGIPPSLEIGTSTTWPSGAPFIAAADWTGRSFTADGTVNEDKRIMADGMGRALQPGTYYVGIRNPNWGSKTMSYTIMSRGIGDGLTLPVTDLPFNGGSATNTALSPREAAYYRVVIPAGASSLKVRLAMTGGEGMLVALSNTVPSVRTGKPGITGRAMQIPGNEQYVLLPASPLAALGPSTNYFAVVSEGVSATNATKIGTGTSSYVIQSQGELQVIDLGVAGPAADLVQTGALEAGETRAYQFSVQPGLSSLEARLENATGNPAMVLRVGPRFPYPGAASTVAGTGSVVNEDYGNEGGYTVAVSEGNANSRLITVANPTNGVYTLMVKARSANLVFTNATYTLRVRALNVTLVDYDGGFSTVTNQGPSTWRYFFVDVPDTALGWDVRLINVASGLPRIAVRRDLLPNSLLTVPWSTPGFSTNWPTTNQWAAGSDWTRRTYTSDGVTIEDGRILAMGMGQPLEPGSYYIGVMNSAASTNMTYTIQSRGIGDNLSLPVTDLPYDGGSFSVSSVAPREAVYYRVTIPAGSPGWKVKLSTTSGDSMLVVLKDHVPNVQTGSPGSPISGKYMQKANDEHYVLLPTSPQTNLPAGTYYLAVVSEGVNPAFIPSKIGTANSSFTITSEGDIPLPNLGSVGPVDLVQSDALEGGECKLYQFIVPPATPSFEVRLEGAVGNPVIALRYDQNLVYPGMASTVLGPGSVGADDYGNDGGYTPNSAQGNANSSLLTVANPTNGLYTIAVKARKNTVTGLYPDASYTLRVRQIPIPQLNFSSEQNTNGLPNSASGLLLNNESAFYRVVVPTNLNGSPVVGWELDASQSSGLASIRVRKDLLPSDVVSGMPFALGSAVIAPPLLTNGTWYVEVRGSNSTSFTLTSKALVLQRPAWQMQGVGDPVTTPGLTAPEFGDTDVDTNGVQSSVEGTDLQQGYYHYYAVNVPTNNGGILRVELKAISGNPDLFLRTNQVPTASHGSTGPSPPLADRSLNGTTTQYPNWVPLDGKNETMLKPGLWYLAVRASGTANARYRLRLSTGYVQDLALDGGTATNQVVAGSDWRYYRVTIPADSTPVNWSVTFSQQAGDVVLHMRDTVPPGNGASITDYRDWVLDHKNTFTYLTYDPPGTYTFSVPPVRPGAVYYLGFRAVSDATFSVTSTISGGTMPVIPTIDFYGGTATNVIPPQGQAMYRIYAPPDASRWKHTSIHSNLVHLFLANGVPATPTAYIWPSSGPNSTLNQYMSGWPWIPNVNYYLYVTNTAAVAQPFYFAMDGKSVITDDSDSDGLPDRWEIQYFGNITSQNGNGDFDGDGVSNLSEYLEGTNPADNTSLRPRLTVLATNGVVFVSPSSSNYPYGTMVTLTPQANSGFDFAGWSGGATGEDNPLHLVLTSSLTVIGNFKVPGDDFVQRIPIVGYSNVMAGSTVGATREPGEPSHAGTPGGSSIWWTWTAPFSGPVTIASQGTGFMPALAAYTGSDVTSLSVVTSDIGSGGANISQMSFIADAGVEYQIAVDGVGGGSGLVSLSLVMNGLFALTDPVQQPINGAFQFTVIGQSGQVVRLDATTDFITWVTLTNLMNSSGSVQFVDPTATNFTYRFYRAVGP